MLWGEIRHWFTLFEPKKLSRLLWSNANVYGFIRWLQRRLFYYTFNKLVIIGVNFGKQHFQKLIVKLNSFYKDCVVPQVLKKKKKNIEKFFFATNHFMFSSKKVNKYNILYVIDHTKDHIFFYLTTDWFCRNFQAISKHFGEQVFSKSKSS